MRTQPFITSPCKASSSVITLESSEETEHPAPGRAGRMWESCNLVCPVGLEDQPSSGSSRGNFLEHKPDGVFLLPEPLHCPTPAGAQS